MIRDVAVTVTRTLITALGITAAFIVVIAIVIECALFLFGRIS